MNRPAADNLPRKDIPRPLREIWLSYHRLELCQELDAVFVFRPEGLEIWCVVESAKSFEKLSALIEERNAGFPVEIYATHPPADREGRDERTPPPSLWNNSEIRDYLGDPQLRERGRLNDPQILGGIHEPDTQIKQRIMAYADQVIEQSVRMKRFALDLPALAWAAFDAGAGGEIAEPAREVGLQHVREVRKLAQRLAADLSRAFPRAERQAAADQPSGAARGAGISPQEQAARLSEAAQAAAHRVYRFIYPEQHTVGLADLREPSLLVALQDVARMAADYLALAAGARRRG